MSEEEKLSLAAVTQRLQDHIENDERARMELNHRLDALDGKVDKLVAAFEQGRGMIRLLSWLAALGTLLAVVGGFLKDLFLLLRH